MSSASTKAKSKQPIDVNAIRQAARNLDDGAVPSGYQGDRQAIIVMLNAALATELVCVMRYKRHYYTATGLINEPIKAEFLQHAQEEEDHAGRIAERIVQLNGEPDFNPSTISQRSHAEYDECTDIKGKIGRASCRERVCQYV